MKRSQKKTPQNETYLKWISWLENVSSVLLNHIFSCGIILYATICMLLVFQLVDWISLAVVICISSGISSWAVAFFFKYSTCLNFKATQLPTCSWPVAVQILFLPIDLCTANAANIFAMALVFSCWSDIQNTHFFRIPFWGWTSEQYFLLPTPPPRLFLFSVMVRRFVFILMNVYHYYSWMRTACSHDLLRRAVHVSHHFVVLIRCCGYYSNMSTGIRFRPAEVLENGAVYVNNGFATQRPAPRQSEYLHGDRKIEGRAQKGRMTWTTH